MRHLCKHMMNYGVNTVGTVRYPGKYGKTLRALEIRASPGPGSPCRKPLRSFLGPIKRLAVCSPFQSLTLLHPSILFSNRG